MKTEAKKKKVELDPFLFLSNEMVVMVANYLDVSSYLAFASSSTTLMGILYSERQWKILLEKTRMDAERLTGWRFGNPCKNSDDLELLLDTEKRDMEREVKKAANFLKLVKDPKAKLLLALLHTICERFPAEHKSEDEFRAAVVSLSCPCNATHYVTQFGFSLLEKAETTVGGAQNPPKQKLLAFNMGYEVIECLEEFASRTSRQRGKTARLEALQVSSLDCDNISDRSKEAWMKLLQNCKQWTIEALYETDRTICGENIADLFEVMAKEAGRGKIDSMDIFDRVIAQTTRAQLKRLWKITGGIYGSVGWFVQCFNCGRNIEKMRRGDPVYGGWEWSKALAIIKKIQTKEHAHYITCVPK